jgi:transposase
MNPRFTSIDYDAVLKQTVRIQDVLPEQHLARFIVAAISQFDLTAFYARYGERGGAAIAPEVLLGMLLYGYASGVFSSRKLERATYESIPFRYVAAGLHPDHDTIAHFRQTFLAEIKALFVQVLVLAQTYGALKLGNISLDGTKIHADASKSKAVSYKRAGRWGGTCRARQSNYRAACVRLSAGTGVGRLFNCYWLSCQPLSGVS